MRRHFRKHEGTDTVCTKTQKHCLLITRCITHIFPVCESNPQHSAQYHLIHYAISVVRGPYTLIITDRETIVHDINYVITCRCRYSKNWSRFKKLFNNFSGLFKRLRVCIGYTLKLSYAQAVSCLFSVLLWLIIHLKNIKPFMLLLKLVLFLCHLRLHFQKCSGFYLAISNTVNPVLYLLKKHDVTLVVGSDGLFVCMCVFFQFILVQ